MMTSKKGLSAIVTTLIIIALALVAIGIIWYVVNNVLSTAQTQVTTGTENLFQTCAEAGGTEMLNATYVNSTSTCSDDIQIVGGEYCCISS